MTVVARQLPGGRRAIADLSPCETTPSIHAESSQTDLRSAPQTVYDNQAFRRVARSEYAWVEAAAMAGARTPRG